MTDSEAIQRFGSLLGDHGFSPWQEGDMSGWHRHIDFVKDCLAGEICRYSVDDYIVLQHRGKASERWLKDHCKPKEDVMKQRFLLLDCPEQRLEVKSFWLGLGGWLEILHYKKGAKEKRFEDLIYFAEKFARLKNSAEV